MTGIRRSSRLNPSNTNNTSVVVPSSSATKRKPISSQTTNDSLDDDQVSTTTTTTANNLLNIETSEDDDDDDFVIYVPTRRRQITSSKVIKPPITRSKRIKMEHSIPSPEESNTGASVSSSSSLSSIVNTPIETSISHKQKSQRESPSAAIIDAIHQLKTEDKDTEDDVKKELLATLKHDIGLLPGSPTSLSSSSIHYSPSSIASSSSSSTYQQERKQQHDSELESLIPTPVSGSPMPQSDSETANDELEELANTVNYRRRRRGRGRGGRAPAERLSWYKRTNLKLLVHHPELKTVWDSLENAEAIQVTPIEQPEYLKLSLLPFQKYGVAWMMQQEKREGFKGGILADEMGMGKTIQTISLLLSDYGKKPNLIVAPTVAIMQWQHEIQTHTKNDMKVYVFHGSNRTKSVKELESYDVVITTYSVAESCFRKQEYGFKRQQNLVKEMSILHKVQWHRIVLDEAHNIKDRSSNTARSVFGLKSEFRWSLSGTPLQNRVGELYSLIRFMRADPYGYYYCKSCKCKNLNWRFSDKAHCDECKHTPMDHVCWWNNEILKPIQAHGYVGEGRQALDKLRLLLDRMMLRRTKVQCADDLGLPPRTIMVRRDLFNEAEEEVYRSLFSDTARRFNDYVEEGSVLNNYANIFELLTKMRQCANHPDLVTKKKGNAGYKQLVCMLCNETPEDPISSACRHTFCRECCKQYLQSFDDVSGGTAMSSPKCPSCYAEFSVDLSQPPLEIELGEGEHPAFSKASIVNRIDMEKWRSSSKIEALVEELSKLRSEDRTVKSIVFSQFVSFLDLIYWRLSRMGFACIRLDGSMSPTQRAAAIDHFTVNPTVTVFLISLKAGGVALNLTEASRVFICDPWWNPAAELQAMDRIHRLGQYRPIRITRLVIENSIESRIIQLQEKKTALVNSTIDRDQAALERLTVEDLQFLFAM
ncbi:SNF2 family N-terminal domain-containing protein [Halteromyces radiatus]|uniref:SNF2 family N-terminal domain-containing protein n=1 Tax=Halteromyces radiatus TaxID=101107 RepID=UPI00221F743C|nr:SNF2 family N-terminal domain-containing protein [Halteromyces radiatus]KAI8085212.1 SNF2 family N-terminal domain-containing protein [Halteromyces radiatus]